MAGPLSRGPPIQGPMGVMKRCVTCLENFPDTPLFRHRGWRRSAAERKTLLSFWSGATDSLYQFQTIHRRMGCRLPSRRPADPRRHFSSPLPHYRPSYPQRRGGNSWEPQRCGRRGQAEPWRDQSAYRSLGRTVHKPCTRRVNQRSPPAPRDANRGKCGSSCDRS